jgi:glycosyltransferase involved in cell wall biosynthesis
MKVIFTFSGLPHYLIALLNKLVLSHGIEVSVIIPGQRGISLGEGVKLINESDDLQFSVVQLEEYKGKLNKPYFRNLGSVLLELSPDILVIGWPYIINLYLDVTARKIIRKNNISLVYREIPFMVAPRNQALKYYRRFPIVKENLEVDNPTGLRFFFWAIGLNQMRKRYYRLADATMIYASHGFDIHESFGIKRDRIFLTYNSPDTEMIGKVRKRLMEQGLGVSNPKRIVHLGRLVKWKRVDLLIKAIALLSDKHPGIELYIIGDGPEEQSLRRYAESNTPKGSVKFLGSIYNLEDLGREIMASSIYVLAGMGGLSINESMAFGKPVVCSRCDGTEKDLVIEGFNGSFFKEGDAVDLASRIDALFDDPDRIRDMGANSLSIIEGKINLETVAQRFMNCFEFLQQNTDH